MHALFLLSQPLHSGGPSAFSSKVSSCQSYPLFGCLLMGGADTTGLVLRSWTLGDSRAQVYQNFEDSTLHLFSMKILQVGQPSL